MLFFPQAPIEPMRWTGEVKAFDCYVTPDCEPREYLGRVYAARKRFEDGTTTTIVQSIPREAEPQSLKAEFWSYGSIERDRKGLPARMAMQFYSHRGDGRNKPNDLLASGTLETQSSAFPNIADPRAVILDPMEVFAFGRPSPATYELPLAAFRLRPAEGANIGVRFVSGSPYLSRVFFQDRFESFQRIDIGRVWMDYARNAPIDPRPSGFLLYRPNGGLAAYVVQNPVTSLVGEITTAGVFVKSRRPIPPPESLPPKLKDLWRDQQFQLRDGGGMGAGQRFFVPGNVSPAERNLLLSRIPDRPAKLTAPAPDEVPVG